MQSSPEKSSLTRVALELWNSRDMVAKVE